MFYPVRPPWVVWLEHLKDVITDLPPSYSTTHKQTWIRAIGAKPSDKLYEFANLPIKLVQAYVSVSLEEANAYYVFKEAHPTITYDDFINLGNERRADFVRENRDAFFDANPQFANGRLNFLTHHLLDEREDFEQGEFPFNLSMMAFKRYRSDGTEGAGGASSAYIFCNKLACHHLNQAQDVRHSKIMECLYVVGFCNVGCTRGHEALGHDGFGHEALGIPGP